jgi:hypothetical protein
MTTTLRGVKHHAMRANSQRTKVYLRRKHLLDEVVARKDDPQKWIAPVLLHVSEAPKSRQNKKKKRKQVSQGK